MSQATDPVTVGARIEALLDASAVGGPVARERAEELVRLVVDLYGAGLERLLEIAYDAGALNDGVLAALAADDLVSSLLLVHGLHPYPVQDRVRRALADVRPYLGSHGGDVRLLEVTDQGVVQLELLGSCDGCASSAVTLELAIEDAVRAAAPEVVAIEVRQPASPASGVIPVESLTSRLRAADSGGVHWATVAALVDLEVGGVLRITTEGTDLVLLRLTSGVYAYRDACAGCGACFQDARMQRSPAAAGGVVLTCPGCGAHFDVRRAGADLADPDRHLDPLPLLERDGVVQVAVRPSVPA